MLTEEMPEQTQQWPFFHIYIQHINVNATYHLHLYVEYNINISNMLHNHIEAVEIIETEQFKLICSNWIEIDN